MCSQALVFPSVLSVQDSHPIGGYSKCQLQEDCNLDLGCELLIGSSIIFRVLLIFLDLEFFKKKKNPKGGIYI